MNACVRIYQKVYVEGFESNEERMKREYRE